MDEPSTGEVAAIRSRFLSDSVRILAYLLILYGVLGLILVRVGLWKSPPVDTFYYAFAFGLYLDLRVELRELRKDLRGKKEV
jgi:hypothetical protein